MPPPSVETPPGVPPAGLPAYAAFLCSLVTPGLGQILAGASGRGWLLLALAATTGPAVLLPQAFPHHRWAQSAGPLLPTVLAAVVWVFAAYDAWFLVRERDNGMRPLLRRTPRVAAFLDLLWGGSGHLYLGQSGALFLGALTLAGATVWVFSHRPWVLALLAVWNGLLALRSHATASRLYHDTPAYALCKAQMEAAPMTSRRAPSPSLPLATLVAVFIATVGSWMVLGPAGPPATTGRLVQGRFQDELHRFELDLPGAPWLFRLGPAPFSLTGHLASRDESLTLSILPVYPGTNRRDAAAGHELSKEVQAEVNEMTRQFDGFHLLSRSPLAGEQFPGFRIVFRARSPGGLPQIIARSYHACEGGILILTLAQPAAQAEQQLRTELNHIISNLKHTDGITP